MDPLAERLKKYVNENNLYGRNGYGGLNALCRQLFRHVGELRGQSLLEIGGGQGLMSMWALAHGVEQAVVMEPESAGTRHGSAAALERHQQALEIAATRLKLVTQTLQEYAVDDTRFDLVLSHNSINHLDEPACLDLQHSEKARASYLNLFAKVFGLIRPGGWFIICDAGRINYWAEIGLPPPLAPTIEWEKHQEPEVWLGLLKEAGFHSFATNWRRFYPLRWLGSLGESRILARLVSSAFILAVRRPGPAG